MLGAAAAVRELAKAGVVRVIEREAALEAVAPIGDAADRRRRSDAHRRAGARPSTRSPRAMRRSPAPFAPFLLHGVTGSGKTEVYLRVIAEALAAGKTALVLVPEISLTPQLAARFRARFGDQVAILHSGLSEQARLGEWSRLRRGEARIAVGARSAVFAPLANLGVIVVDEEHDGSFKQEEGVRYHARDVALVRAQRAGAVCVLGSATPSLESYAHAERGAYQRLVADRSGRPRGRCRPSRSSTCATHVPDGEAMLSAPLRAAIGETLAAGDQIDPVPQPPRLRDVRAVPRVRPLVPLPALLGVADVSPAQRSADLPLLRLRRSACPRRARAAAARTRSCARASAPRRSPTRSPPSSRPARVARLDRDVASGAKIEAVLARVARREVDILVGTQMVTKGHDFPGVTLVGVLCADTGLDLPDFRASERTFQLLAQVAGRAGRGDRAGPRDRPDLPAGRAGRGRARRRTTTRASSTPSRPRAPSSAIRRTAG